MEIIVEKERIVSLLNDTMLLKDDDDDYLFTVVFHEKTISVEYHRVLYGIIEEGRIMNDKSFVNVSFPYISIRIWEPKELLEFLSEMKSDCVKIRVNTDAIWCDSIGEIFFPVDD
ncbi:MAG: hypothetical protein JHC31_12035 [Sulfurihydrogenibium sp.]|jgi:hypothetical protein|nr:hypothetical protein [Sulfurihydrogenibium sp.]